MVLQRTSPRVCPQTSFYPSVRPWAGARQQQQHEVFEEKDGSVSIPCLCTVGMILFFTGEAID